MVTFLSIILILLDLRSDYLVKARVIVTSAVYPIHVMAAVPSKFIHGLSDYFESRHQLQIENESLVAEKLLNNARLLKLQTLETENNRLRSLLGSSFRLQERVLVAELVTVDLDPFSQWVSIDKGFEDGVSINQAVLDAQGVMGQVVDVSQWTSTVVLLTDPSHAVPIQINRNGLRAVAVGQGLGQPLKLIHMPQNSDVQVGDVLNTSGLGGRFPQGYPVGTVVNIGGPAGEAFAEIDVAPLAKINTSRELLLVLPGEKITSSIPLLKEEEGEIDSPDETGLPEVTIDE